MESGEALRLHRADAPAHRRDFFDLAPVLAVHDGPWAHSRRLRLGAALKICGWTAGCLLVVAVVLDQLRAETFLDDFNKVAVGLAAAFLAVLVLAGAGASVSAGRLRHAPSGVRLRVFTETYHGTEAGAAAVHSVLSTLNDAGGDPVTWRDLTRLTRESGAGAAVREVVVSAYEAARADVAIATVHVRAAEDEVVVWPPISIPRDAIPGLVRPDHDTTDWSAQS